MSGGRGGCREDTWEVIPAKSVRQAYGRQANLWKVAEDIFDGDVPHKFDNHLQAHNVRVA